MIRMMSQYHERQARLFRRALSLEYFTVVYNALEAALSIFFGYLAGSIALVGFGLDSVVESLSGLVLIWRLRKHGKISTEEEERVEKKAMKFVAVTFFVLGLYILIQSLRKLALKEMPDPSLPGILIALVSLVVMPLLSVAKRRTGEEIRSGALIADSKETLACSFLSFALLMGLGLNYLFGWWFADAIAGIFIVLFLIHEGLEAWREVECAPGRC
jgi:cation diffusion facilitator family transporter